MTAIKEEGPHTSRPRPQRFGTRGRGIRL